MHRYLMLHNIRSAHNVGSIFRTADAAGVAKIYLSGYTPTPLDRFGRVREEIKKTSLGASESVPYDVLSDPMKAIETLQSEGVEIVCVEQTPDAIPYTEHHPKGDCLFILGNEITGIEPELLTRADTHIQIPMSGMKESLNVSVCTGVILFHARDAH